MMTTIFLIFDNAEIWRDKSNKRIIAKKPLKTWNVDVNNLVISTLVETKTNSKYLIGYLNKVIRPLVLILSKMSWYVETFKVKDGVKDKNNILMSFRIDDEKLLEKYKTILTKNEDFKSIELNANQNIFTKNEVFH